jgi:hypothetical protein
MNLRFFIKVDNCLTKQEAVIFSRRTMIHGFSKRRQKGTRFVTYISVHGEQSVAWIWFAFTQDDSSPLSAPFARSVKCLKLPRQGASQRIEWRLSVLIMSH